MKKKKRLHFHLQRFCFLVTFSRLYKELKSWSRVACVLSTVSLWYWGSGSQAIWISAVPRRSERLRLRRLDFLFGLCAALLAGEGVGGGGWGGERDKAHYTHTEGSDGSSVFELVFTAVEKKSYLDTSWPCDLLYYATSQTHTKKNYLANTKRVGELFCLAHREQLHVEEGFGDELLVSSAVSSQDFVCVRIGADDGHGLVTIPLELACNQLGSTWC